MQEKTEKKIKELLAQLNESQREAVEYCNGPSLVVAGAGSGKTRVLTYKIAYLIMYGVLPYRILALTFTNKAAREMKERIGNLVDKDLADRLYMGTFHSVFSRILRAEAQRIGYNSNFTIYEVAPEVDYQDFGTERQGLQAVHGAQHHIDGEEPAHRCRRFCCQQWRTEWLERGKTKSRFANLCCLSGSLQAGKRHGFR